MRPNTFGSHLKMKLLLTCILLFILTNSNAQSLRRNNSSLNYLRKEFSIPPTTPSKIAVPQFYSPNFSRSYSCINNSAPEIINSGIRTLMNMQELKFNLFSIHFTFIFDSYITSFYVLEKMKFIQPINPYHK